MDLSDNKIPFGLLTPEEQEHMRKWPHGVELYASDGWEYCKVPVWLKSLTYRTRPAPKPELVTQVHWSNDYDTVWGGAEWHDSREGADYYATFDRIAVIRREWTEGQPPKYFTENV